MYSKVKPMYPLAVSSPLTFFLCIIKPTHKLKSIEKRMHN